MDKEEKNVEMVHLSPYMKSVIERLTADKKRPAVHTYNATLNSFTKFFGGQGTEEMLVTDVFTAGKLKEYEAWLRSRNASWNTVSTYMRVLKAVYNRLVEAKRLTYDARLFDSVYTCLLYTSAHPNAKTPKRRHRRIAGQVTITAKNIFHRITAYYEYIKQCLVA